MKVCLKCGVAQKDTNSLCIDCGTPLGAPLSAEETVQYEAHLREKIAKRAEKQGYFDTYSLAYEGSVRTVLLVINAMVALISLCMLLGIVELLVPVKEIGWGALALLCSVVAAVGVAFPDFCWKLHSLRYAMYTRDSNLEPSDIYILSMRWTNLISTALGVIFLLVAFL